LVSSRVVGETPTTAEIGGYQRSLPCVRVVGENTNNGGKIKN